MILDDLLDEEIESCVEENEDSTVVSESFQPLIRMETLEERDQLKKGLIESNGWSALEHKGVDLHHALVKPEQFHKKHHRSANKIKDLTPKDPLVTKTRAMYLKGETPETICLTLDLEAVTYLKWLQRGWFNPSHDKRKSFKRNSIIVNQI